jgi:hypothetical protein
MAPAPLTVRVPFSNVHVRLGPSAPQDPGPQLSIGDKTDALFFDFLKDCAFKLANDKTTTNKTKCGTFVCFKHLSCSNPPAFDLKPILPAKTMVISTSINVFIQNSSRIRSSVKMHLNLRKMIKNGRLTLNMSENEPFFKRYRKTLYTKFIRTPSIM